MHVRYEGKPLLRLLECYVLQAIGQLPMANQKKLETMTPKLAEIYGHSGRWDEIIAKIMNFPEDASDRIVAVWKKEFAIAETEGKQLEPESFAQSFVDRYF